MMLQLSASQKEIQSCVVVSQVLVHPVSDAQTQNDQAEFAECIYTELESIGFHLLIIAPMQILLKGMDEAR